MRATEMTPENRRALVLVKGVHTFAWAVLAGCVLALPLAALGQHFELAAVLAGAVLLETAVLAVNGWRCPLTDVAARYTADREDNFDIYLPLWLARYNKQVFGTLFVLGGLVSLWAWLR